MRVVLFFSFFILCISYSCNHSAAEIENIDFCKMLDRDQMHVNGDKSNLPKYKTDRKKRREIFYENFDNIVKITKSIGFPSINTDNISFDSCRYWGVNMTLIHITQNKPELIFNDEIIFLFKDEINKGNLARKTLRPIFIMGAKTNKFCEGTRGKITKAIREWGIETDFFDKAEFIECG